MKRVCVVCEGQSEETFVRNVLAPAFSALDLQPMLVETSRGHKGGGLTYARVKSFVCNTLKQSSAPVVTTFLDLYRLDPGFPGFEQSLKQRDLSQRLEVLKRAWHDDVVTHVGWRAERFIPYIQPYEFEALLFSDVSALVQVEQGWRSAGKPLAAVRRAAESPEHINDSPENKPAAHLARELKNPSYRKMRHGPLAARKIGLDKMEAQCAFFAQWLQQLRDLA